MLETVALTMMMATEADETLLLLAWVKEHACRWEFPLEGTLATALLLT